MAGRQNKRCRWFLIRLKSNSNRTRFHWRFIIWRKLRSRDRRRAKNYAKQWQENYYYGKRLQRKWDRQVYFRCLQHDHLWYHHRQCLPHAALLRNPTMSNRIRNPNVLANRILLLQHGSGSKSCAFDRIAFRNKNLLCSGAPHFSIRWCQKLDAKYFIHEKSRI